MYGRRHKKGSRRNGCPFETFFVSRLPNEPKTDLQAARIGAVRESAGRRTGAEAVLISERRNTGHRCEYILAAVEAGEVAVVEDIERVEGERRLVALAERKHLRKPNVNPFDVIAIETIDGLEGHASTQAATAIAVQRASIRRRQSCCRIRS